MEYEKFGRKVKQAFEDSKRRYGAVKLCLVLNGAGTPCSIKRVQRHMEEQGLRSVVVKKYNHHANHGSIPDDKVNILKRDFGTETINQNGAQILPTSMCRKKDGLIWRLSWICAAVKSSAMPMAHL